MPNIEKENLDFQGNRKNFLEIPAGHGKIR